MLAYGGLHWSRDAILDMPTDARRWHVARMLKQKKEENRVIAEAGKPQRM